MRLRLAGALALLVAASCGGEPEREDPVVARLGGTEIRRSEVSAPAAFRLYRYEAQAYALLEEETLRLVDERLLAEAARREGLAPGALLARAEAEAAPVSEADVERYLREHGATEGPSARERVRSHLEERARIERRLALQAELRERAGFEWLLAKPTPPRARIAAPEAPARGAEAARVTLVHLASFASPESARSAREIARLVAAHPGEIRWLHVSFPREGDALAARAARLGFVAQEEGRFWELHDALFARAGRLDAGALEAAAREAGLAAGALERADAEAIRERLGRDAALARRAGARREPTLFVNGRYWSGLGAADELRRIFEEERRGAVDARSAGR